MLLTLVRHTSLNVPSHICYGQSDIDVSAQFESELQKLQAKLAHHKFDAIYSSPLQRCHKLAHAISTHLDLAPIQLDERLKELHFGDWELNAWDDIPREVFDTWANDYANLAPPNGETFAQLHARAKSFVEDVSLHSQDKHLLIITHGGLIRALIAEVLQIPLKRLFRMTIDHVSITQLEFNDAIPKVHFMNL